MSKYGTRLLKQVFYLNINIFLPDAGFVTQRAAMNFSMINRFFS